MLRKFLKDEEGNVAAIAAIAMVPLMAATIASVEFSNMSRSGNELQQSLDSALVEISRNYPNNLTPAQLQEKGAALFTANSNSGFADADLQYLGGSIDAKGNLIIKATASEKYDGVYTHALNQTLKRKASVMRNLGTEACMLALSKTAPSSIDMYGSSSITLDACTMSSNSTSASSITRGGSATVSAECMHTTGGTSGITGSSSATLKCGATKERTSATVDPLAGVVMPSLGTCFTFNLNGGSGWKTLNPNCYNNSKLTVNGGEKVKLNAGTYIFSGTEISILGNSEFDAQGVTIFLVNGASLSVSANSIFTVTAPTTGTYKGIAIYNSPSNPTKISLLGGSNQFVQGYIYNPSGAVEFGGNSSGTGKQCVRLVANTIGLTGNSTFKVNCSTELGGRIARTSNQIVFVD